ncbi:hypothetical protein [Schumannella luteola]
MQEGWAVVVGAAIALLGSVLAPWVTSRVDGDRSRRQARRDALRAAIGDHIELIVRANAAGQSPDERRASFNLASVAGSRLALLLEDREVAVEDIGDHTLEALVLTPPGDPEVAIRVSAYQKTEGRTFAPLVPTSAQIHTDRAGLFTNIWSRLGNWRIDLPPHFDVHQARALSYQLSTPFLDP